MDNIYTVVCSFKFCTNKRIIFSMILVGNCILRQRLLIRIKPLIGLFMSFIKPMVEQ